MTGGGLSWPKDEHLQEGLTQQFQAFRFVHLPKLLDAESAVGLERQTRDLAARRVNCRGGKGTWDEQNIFDGPLHRCLRQTETTAFLQRLLGTTAPLRRLVCWTSRYLEGEYINTHRDAEGSIQLLLCLSACPPENGGALVLGEPVMERLHLMPGDAVVFEATSVPHSTTPLRAGPGVPSPRRVVAVGRYFFGDGG